MSNTSNIEPAQRGYQVNEFLSGDALQLSRNEGVSVLSRDPTWPHSCSQPLLNRYPDLRPLQVAYANWVKLPCERIVPTAGGDEGIERVIRSSLSGTKRTVVGHHPSFEMIDIYTQNAGGNRQVFPWLDGPFPTRALLERLDEQTALVTLVTPNNPTGNLIPLDELLLIARELERRSIHLLVDLAYIEFADVDPTQELAGFQNVYMIRTLSKAWGLAGLRVGFVIAPDAARASELRAWGGPFSISNLSQQLACLAITQHSAELTHFVKQTQSIRTVLFEVLNEAGWSPRRSQGNFVLCQFPNAKGVAESLRQQAIAVRQFAATELQDFLRITCPPDWSGLGRLVRALPIDDALRQELFKRVQVQFGADLNTRSAGDSMTNAVGSGQQRIARDADSMNEGDLLMNEIENDRQLPRRIATIDRETRETKIGCSVDLDGTGESSIDTGLGFLDHMLTSLARHSGIDLHLSCRGDLEVDDHHTSEDCAIVLGMAIDQALGNRQGIRRFGCSYAPLDESLTRAVIDFSGRSWHEIHLTFTRPMVGAWGTENVVHFFQTLAVHLRACIHLDLIRGGNDHHRIEASFKALALALREAVQRVDDQIRSTKGVL